LVGVTFGPFRRSGDTTAFADPALRPAPHPGSPMSQLSRPPIPHVVQQHVEESAMLRHLRSVLVRAPHVTLRLLGRLDERLAAHLDGVRVAGDYGAARCREALERPGCGEVFAAAVTAIERGDLDSIDRLLDLAQALPDARRGLLSAFGWVPGERLRGIVGPLLQAASTWRRTFGLAVCRLQGVDPGPPLVRALDDAASGLRVEALRSAGAAGRIDLATAVAAAMDDADPHLRSVAAISACLLGRGDTAATALPALALEHPAQTDGDVVLALAVQALPFDDAKALVRAIGRAEHGGSPPSRRLVRACGVLGDTQAIEWLIGLMAKDSTARLAGESFTTITGADLAALDLERKPPEGFESGPSDDPGDEDVDLDEDESLPWPDVERVRDWWRRRAPEMPEGRRLFLGAEPTPPTVLRVLREGTQRQRLVAARWRCLLQPGTPLFATAAPCWRQQRRLAAA
jgi:uncharacterized protein (TIGR02270 family)